MVIYRSATFDDVEKLHKLLNTDKHLFFFILSHSSYSPY